MQMLFMYCDAYVKDDDADDDDDIGADFMRPKGSRAPNIWALGSCSVCAPIIGRNNFAS